MDYVSLIIGLFIGGLLGYLLHPRDNSDAVNVARLDALLKQQKQDIEALRAKNELLVAEAAAKQREIETLTNVREKMLNDFKAISVELIEQQKESVVGTQKTVLAPVQQEMKDLKEGFDKRVQEMLKNSIENKTSIDEQIKNMLDKSDNLQKEASNLANALKNISTVKMAIFVRILS